ncbi:MAG: hypothetical protein JRJ14_04790 [Deltaproteobacteria bacterium]|nr:hypothetical protein [Deltaproteobacteria bacterium]
MKYECPRGCDTDFIMKLGKPICRLCGTYALEYTKKQTRATTIKLDSETIAILGRPNFACAGIARRLHDLGLYEVKTSAEDEQAQNNQLGNYYNAIDQITAYYQVNGGESDEMLAKMLRTYADWLEQ